MKPYETFFHLLFKDRDPGEFPFRFTVEATNNCNLRCTTCPRLESGRGYGNMDLRLFQRLANQAAERRTTPCCYDHACRLEVGNAKEESVEEIWSGERLSKLRRLHEEGRVDEIDLCRTCHDYVP